MLSTVSELISFQSGVIFRRDCRILRALSSEKTIEIQATISSLDLEICKVAIISCKNKHGTRSAGSRPRLALCNTTPAYTGYTLDTRATPRQHALCILLSKTFQIQKAGYPKRRTAKLVNISSMKLLSSILFCMFVKGDRDV